jgi:hypothetical protein
MGASMLRCDCLQGPVVVKNDRVEKTIKDFKWFSKCYDNTFGQIKVGGLLCRHFMRLLDLHAWPAA